jgi:hypothetical protein
LFSELDNELNDFVQFDPNNLGEFLDRVWAFSWSDTDVMVDLNPIGIGETSTLTYRISTNSWTDAGLRGRELNSIVAFSCFADPVGRGSTSGAMFTIPGFEIAPCDDYKSGGIDNPTNYALKIAQGGNTLFLTRDGAPVVPEPDTWAMLILGFGLVGLSMRRGKKSVPVTAS